MRVRNAMTSPVVTVRATDLVKDVAALLAAHGFSCLPVVDEEGALVGVVTEADLVRGQIPHDPRSPLLPAELDQAPPPATGSEVMTSDVRTVPSTADVADVAATMVHDRLRSLPVLDGEELVGIITRRDLVRVVGREDGVVERDVRHRLSVAFGADWRWTVQVDHGVTTIEDAMDDAADRHTVAVLAAAVPGVLHVDVTHRQQA